MSAGLPFRQTATAGCLAGAASVGAALPLCFLYLLVPKPHGEDYSILVLMANAPLIALLWGVPVWAWARQRAPHFAFGWICTHLAAALINGACLGAMLLKAF